MFLNKKPGIKEDYGNLISLCLTLLANGDIIVVNTDGRDRATYFIH